MKVRKLLLLSLSSFLLTGCGLSEIFEGDTDTIHKSSYEPITGKYLLYDALDKRNSYTDTYFDINGSKGNFSLKYYENGELKKEGVFHCQGAGGPQKQPADDGGGGARDAWYERDALE